MTKEESIKIVEKSWLAKLAALKLRSPKIAMAWGKKILLSGVSKEDFLADTKWLRHEREHLKQIEQLGFLKFLWSYTIESIKHGYHNNKFEIAARAAETNEH